MAESNHNPRTEEMRRGANAAFQALIALTANASRRDSGDDTPAGYYAWRFNAAAALADALGPMPDYLRGAVMVMGEWIHFENSTGTPNPDVWRSIATMTEAELQRDIERDIARMEADFAGVAAKLSNVVPLHR